MVISLLEKLSYETYVTITRFPCCVTHRQEMADGLVNIGFIESFPLGYKISDIGEEFLNNYHNRSKL